MRLLIAALLMLGLAACGEPAPKEPFRIVAGSENKSLEPIVMEFCKRERRVCEMDYLGSLDIGLGVKRGTLAVDAVWPAQSLWISIYDDERKVKHLTSITRTPVILGVRKSKAESLGWTQRDVTMSDILAAVEDGKLRFLMTSATQSNSGASAYLAMLSAALGRPDVIKASDLDTAETQDAVRRMLRGVERSAGSSGWLADLFLESDAQGTPYDAMWNYEMTLVEVNIALAERRRDPLWFVYPSDGVSFADSPLGFVDRGADPSAEEFFLKLQQHLLSADVQKELVALGRRVSLGRAEAGKPIPAWNFDPTRPLTQITIPESPAIAAALTLYQEVLRRPSFTVYCLDYSGSMKGEGETALRQAMKLLLTPELAREYLIQPTRQDLITIIPFDSAPRADAAMLASGEAADQAALLDVVNREAPGGGTDMYACAKMAIDTIQARADAEDYLTAIVLMTDGKSQDRSADFEAYWRLNGQGVPVFGVAFGKADASQLEAVAALTRARVFEGTDDLVAAFRSVRGYN